MSVQCKRCMLWNDHERLKRDDELGEGYFCNALWKDKKGLYCSTKAAEGRSGCNCPFTEADVKLDCCRLVCSHSEDPKSLVGKCQDFEPSKELRKRFGVKP